MSEDVVLDTLRFLWLLTWEPVSCDLEQLSRRFVFCEVTFVHELIKLVVGALSAHRCKHQESQELRHIGFAWSRIRCTFVNEGEVGALCPDPSTSCGFKREMDGVVVNQPFVECSPDRHSPVDVESIPPTLNHGPKLCCACSSADQLIINLVMSLYCYGCSLVGKECGKSGVSHFLFFVIIVKLIKMGWLL